MKEGISDSTWLIAIEIMFVALAIILFKLTNKADLSFWYLIIWILIGFAVMLLWPRNIFIDFF